MAPDAIVDRAKPAMTGTEVAPPTLPSSRDWPARHYAEAGCRQGGWGARARIDERAGAGAARREDLGVHGPWPGGVGGDVGGVGAGECSSRTRGLRLNRMTLPTNMAGRGPRRPA
jgi:hypothetical protein